MSYRHYSEIASLFDFPEAEYLSHCDRALKVLLESYPEAAMELQRFVDGIPRETLDLQELYTRTFDVQAITTLDVGYVMFGDDYKRAELLANLSREHAAVENSCGVELGDHLPNILRLIPRLAKTGFSETGGPASELIQELIQQIVIPSLMLMIREFDSERIVKKNEGYRKHYKTLIAPAPGGDPTIYCCALKAILRVLMDDFEVTESADRSEPTGRASDFFKFIEKELEIETNANPVNSGCDS